MPAATSASEHSSGGHEHVDSTGGAGAGHALNRGPRAQYLTQLQQMYGRSAHGTARAPNNTGLPNQLKAGIESLSGMSMDKVKVHYNSAQPAQLNALAYARGTDIHIAPGQEQHLPHEAWHVVQQAQGRVRPTMRMSKQSADSGPPEKSAVPVNDNKALEHEADIMGARASGHPSSSEAPRKTAAPSPLTHIAATLNATPRVQQLRALSGVVQRVIIPSDGDLEAARDRLALKGVPQDVADHYQSLVTSYTEEEVVLAHNGANAKKPMQSSFPKLVRAVDQDHVPENSLIFRGMSVNNVNNLKLGTERNDTSQVIFKAQNPQGEATAVDHIVDDDRDSPFLSFESGGYNISAGKYAPKPIKLNNKPHGVKRDNDGFLKQKQSYTGETRKKYSDSKRVGYFAGLDPNDLQTLDVSTTELAAQHLDDASQERRDNARRIAVNDREVLLTPGTDGVPRSKVPFIGKIKQVTKNYYERKRNRQTPSKALGYFKPANSAASTKTDYYKVQIPQKYHLAEHDYAFDIPEHLKKQDDDSGSDISDVESVDLNLSDGDFSEDEGANQ